MNSRIDSWLEQITRLTLCVAWAGFGVAYLFELTPAFAVVLYAGGFGLMFLIPELVFRQPWLQSRIEKSSLMSHERKIYPWIQICSTLVLVVGVSIIWSEYNFLIGLVALVCGVVVIHTLLCRVFKQPWWS